MWLLWLPFNDRYRKNIYNGPRQGQITPSIQINVLKLIQLKDYNYSDIFKTFILHDFSSFCSFLLVMTECPKVHLVTLRFMRLCVCVCVCVRVCVRLHTCVTYVIIYVTHVTFVNIYVTLELLAFIDFHQSKILAIQETKIDNSILTSELFPESFPYSVYRKDRTLNGGGVMLLVHKDIPHMPLTELDNDSESVWVKLFVNKKTHFVASWYRPPVDGHLPVSDNGNDLLNSLEKFDNLFREQLDKIKNINKGNKPPLIHVLGDFNFRDSVWPDRLSKSGSSLSQTEGQILIDIMNDHGLEQLVNFPTRERNTLDLILTSLPGQFADIHSPDKLSDHDIVSGTLKIAIPPIKKPRRKVYRYQKGDYESMRAETLKFAKERYFNGYSDTRSVQENFNLITSFIQESADKHIPSKTSRSVSSVPWITPEIRRKIRRKNATHAKAKKTGSAKFRSKFESLRKEIKADIRKQHDLYVNNLVGDVKANPRDFYRYINSQKKIPKVFPR